MSDDVDVSLPETSQGESRVWIPSSADSPLRPELYDLLGLDTSQIGRWGTEQEYQDEWGYIVPTFNPVSGGLHWEEPDEESLLGASAHTVGHLRSLRHLINPDMPNNVGFGEQVYSLAYLTDKYVVPSGKEFLTGVSEYERFRQTDPRVNPDGPYMASHPHQGHVLWDGSLSSFGSRAWHGTIPLLAYGVIGGFEQGVFAIGQGQIPLAFGFTVPIPGLAQPAQHYDAGIPGQPQGFQLAPHLAGQPKDSPIRSHTTGIIDYGVRHEWPYAVEAEELVHPGRSAVIKSELADLGSVYMLGFNPADPSLTQGTIASGLSRRRRR